MQIELYIRGHCPPQAYDELRGEREERRMLIQRETTQLGARDLVTQLYRNQCDTIGSLYS